jgi:BirA family transcriptional regulator, biotin operon repressor / biotin---[acetyl-CoA-carboxylase] ligase
VTRFESGPLGQQRRELAECESTNDVALAWARAGAAHGAVVIADAQTAGRGRYGRTWASPPGHNVYLSLILRWPRAVPVAPLTLAIGVGLCDAVRGVGVIAAGLKWPNDLLVAGRKLAGVLCESTGDAVVVGIGINGNGTAAELPANIAGRAATVCEQLGRPIDRRALIDRVLLELAPWVDRYQSAGIAAIVPAWEARMVAGLRVTTDRGPGIALGLDSDGALRVRTDAGDIHRVVSGDVDAVPE